MGWAAAASHLGVQSVWCTVHCEVAFLCLRHNNKLTRAQHQTTPWTIYIYEWLCVYGCVCMQSHGREHWIYGCTHARKRAKPITWARVCIFWWTWRKWKVAATAAAVLVACSRCAYVLFGGRELRFRVGVGGIELHTQIYCRGAYILCKRSVWCVYITRKTRVTCLCGVKWQIKLAYFWNVCSRAGDEEGGIRNTKNSSSKFISE